MPKAGRKKREKKKDFQKIKLKVGKRKLPANNATDTSFKSQAIFIPDQLKTGSTDVGEPVTKRKQNIHDLLTQLGHFNANTRIDALSSLKILLSNNKELVSLHIGKLVEKLPKILVDNENQARKAALSVFKVAFSCLDEEQISPFFNIISTHLQCAMCHLHDVVQQDALKMFDLCLDYFPNLLCGQNKKVILNQFLELISVKQAVSASGNVVKGTRILSMKLSGKESSISWRLKVLKRLSKLLYAIHDISRSSHYRNKDEDVPIELNWDSDGIMEAIKSKEKEIQIYSTESLITRSSISSLSSLTSDLDGHQLGFYKGISVVIIPLMLDCCSEANQGQTSRLNDEGVETMFHVLSIIDFLLNRLLELTDDKTEMISKLRQLYLRDFVKHFFNPFPLIHNPQMQRTKKGSKEQEERNPKEIQEQLLSLNLFITDVLSLLIDKVECEGGDVLRTLSATASYISNVLTIDNKRQNISIQNLKSILKTTKVLLKIAADDNTVTNILMPLLVYCDELQPCQQQRYILMRFIRDVYEEQDGNNVVLDQWLSSLPYMLYSLIKDAAEKRASNTEVKQDGNTEENCIYEKENILPNLFHLMFSAMQIGSNLQNEVYLSNCQSMFIDTLTFMCDNDMFCLPNIEQNSQLKYCSKCKELQKSYIESTLFALPTFENNDAKSLVRFLMSSAVHPDVVAYSCQILLLRIKTSNDVHSKKTCEAAVYVLICTLMIGSLRSDLVNTPAGKDDMSSTNTTLYQISFHNTSEVEIKRQMLVGEEMTKILRWILSYSPPFITFLQFFIKEHVLSHFRVLPFKTAIGVLHIFEIIITSKSDVLNNLIGQFCVDCLLNCELQSAEHKESCSCVRDICFRILQSSKNVFKVVGEILCDLDYTNEEMVRSVCEVITKISSENHFRTSLKSYAQKLLEIMLVKHIGQQQWFCDFKYKVESL